MITDNNVVINEIMSSKSSTSIILTKSDGEHIGFLTDLTNNYRKTFWMSIEFNNNCSFPILFAYNILGDSELLTRLLQFSYCRSDFNKDIIIVNVVLDYISTLNYDCLLILDCIETLPKNFNLRILETILKNCPKNLKIVLVSATFPELNYNIFENSSPKLIEKKYIDVVEFDENIADEDFSRDDWEFLSRISSHMHVTRDIVEKMYPHGVELLQYISLKYRSVIMAKGSDLFCISDKLGDFIKQKKNIDYQRLEGEYTEYLFEYFYSGDGKQYITALKIALESKNILWVDRIMEKIIATKGINVMLRDFIKGYGVIDIIVSSIYKNARYLLILSDLIHGNYNAAYEKISELIEEIPENSPLERRLIRCLAEAMYRVNKKKESAEFMLNTLRARISKYGWITLEYLVDTVEMLPIGLRNSNISLDATKYKIYEKYLTDEKYSSEYWYYSIMQGAVGCNLDLGNYKRGIEQLNFIKKKMPFYVLPHNLISAYFFAGDMELAKHTADEIIYASKWNGVTSNLTDSYVLLGLVSMYYNKITEAQQYLNESVKFITGDESALYNAISVRAMVCAEAGMVEYGKDIALLYWHRCDIVGSKYAPMMAGAVSYCYWVLHDKENAVYYAKKCLEGTTARSAFWLISTAVIINYLFESDDFKTGKTLVGKFLAASKNYGMDVLAVVCNRLFQPILEFAETNSIETEYLFDIKSQLNRKGRENFSDNAVSIRFMGTTSVTIGGKELLWKTKKAKELFLLYVLRGSDGIDRNEIIDTFWGDYVYVSAINNLKTTNNLIRNTLTISQVPFKLEYANSKYTLHINNKEIDYSMYMKLSDSLAEETDLRRRVVTVSRMLNIYGTGFAQDIKVPYFIDISEKLREALGVTLMQLIKDLVKSGDFIEAKRYVTILKKLQVNFDYVQILTDIDKRLLK